MNTITLTLSLDGNELGTFTKDQALSITADNIDALKLDVVLDTIGGVLKQRVTDLLISQIQDADPATLIAISTTLTQSMKPLPVQTISVTP